MAALRRATAARQAEVETARRRLAEVERRAADESGQAERANDERASLEAELAGAREVLSAAVEAEAGAAARRERARERASATEAEHATAHERAVAASASAAAMRAQLDGLEARLADEETRGIARAARRAGGRRLDEDLDIDPTLRAATEAALAEATRAYVVAADAVPTLADGTRITRWSRSARPVRSAPRTPAIDAIARRSPRPVAGPSTRRSDATRQASPDGSSCAPPGCPTWLPASPSRLRCLRVGSR